MGLFGERGKVSGRKRGYEGRWKGVGELVEEGLLIIGF